MIEFDERDLRDLQDVGGVVLRDVHGECIAVGKGFDYENAFDFMGDCFEEYGAEDFAENVGYESSIEMFKDWFSGTPLTEEDISDLIYSAFDGIDADYILDTYDYEEEARLESEDHKLDQARGK